MHTILERDTPFPVQRHLVFSTSEDNQTTFPIRVYEGNDPETKQNLLLGEFTLENLA